jgi:hypothetical protein
VVGARLNQTSICQLGLFGISLRPPQQQTPLRVAHGGGGGGGGGQAKELMEKGSLTMDEYQFERKKIFQDYPGIADIVPR